MDQNELPIPRPKQYHSLKCISPFFEAIRDGHKTFEVRWDDRGYQVGDILILNRYESNTPHMLNTMIKPIVCEVTYVLSGEEWGIKKGFKVLGFKKVALT